MKRILLTGATGFIGSHVLETLAAAGHSVIVMARPNSDLQFVSRFASEVRTGDLLDRASVRRATAGCDLVVHTAGRSSDWGSRMDFDQVNVSGTENVLFAACVEGIRHVIHTGSISSYGEAHCEETKDETWPFDSHYPYFLDRIFPCGFNRYRDSKAVGTLVAMDFATKHGLDLTVLEPAWVFGEREFHTGFYSYLQTVRSGWRWLPGSSHNDFHVIYARDLARAYLQACETSLPGVQRFIIANPQPEPMARLFDTFCAAAGLRPPHRLPKALAYPVGFALELGYALIRSPKPPLLTRGRVNMFYDTIRFSAQKADSVLGFRCEYGVEEAVKKTVAWYREEGFL